MASANNVKNAKEIVEYYNRKFVVNVTGRISIEDKTLKCQIPPLNETGFSGNYSQCLIRIKEISVFNDGTTFALSLNPVWVSGISAAAAGGVSVASGIMIRTSIPSRQVKHVSSEFAEATWGIGRLFDQSFHQVVQVETKTSYTRQTAVFDGKESRGTKNFLVNPDVKAAGNGEVIMDESVNYFHFIDTGSFEDSAVLCGNPFGQEHTFQCRDALNGVPIGLAAGSSITTADGHGGTLFIKLEILMLENPSPNDR